MTIQVPSGFVAIRPILDHHQSDKPIGDLPQLSYATLNSPTHIRQALDNPVLSCPNLHFITLSAASPIDCDHRGHDVPRSTLSEPAMSIKSRRG
jgi:hypothetical protein